MAKNLADYLNEYYAALLVHKKPTQKIKNNLNTYLHDNPDKRPEAKDMLKQLESVQDKCFISRIHAQFLTEVING